MVKTCLAEGILSLLLNNEYVYSWSCTCRIDSIVETSHNDNTPPSTPTGTRGMFRKSRIQYQEAWVLWLSGLPNHNLLAPTSWWLWVGSHAYTQADDKVEVKPCLKSVASTFTRSLLEHSARNQPSSITGHTASTFSTHKTTNPQLSECKLRNR